MQATQNKLGGQHAAHWLRTPALEYVVWKSERYKALHEGEADETMQVIKFETLMTFLIRPSVIGNSYNRHISELSISSCIMRSSILCTLHQIL
jgi:hypothetical protein